MDRLSACHIRYNFNPRTHEGCDRRLRQRFQAVSDFNPRTHEGCDDVTPRQFNDDLKISIHAPMKGATRTDFFAIVKFFISIHAPMKGATLTDLADENIKSYFNPRTHEGCDSLQINSVIACFSIIYIAN